MAKVSKGLTQKMKDFCYAYVRSGNATQAYLEAYNTTNDGIARREGSLLLQRSDITEFLTELNRPTVNKITNEREKKRKIIWDRIERCIANENDAAVARYMDILNKMDSEYVNINRNIDETGEKLASLSIEQLNQILDEPVDDD